jgi:hypothetical protein
MLSQSHFFDKYPLIPRVVGAFRNTRAFRNRTFGIFQRSIENWTLNSEPCNIRWESIYKSAD